MEHLKMQYDHMIKEVAEVEDAEATRTYGRGERREDYPDAWADTGRIILVGLPGSGRTALAGLLAARSGLGAVRPVDGGEALAALSGPPAIIILDDALVADPQIQPRIHGAGKVFYLMVDSRTLAQRATGAEAVSDAEPAWRDLSARLAVMEPVFYGVLHFILQGANPPEALVEDALEKIAY
jgi:shikimate kinase